jgi:hypothetical protein
MNGDRPDGDTWEMETMVDGSPVSTTPIIQLMTIIISDIHP